MKRLVIGMLLAATALAPLAAQAQLRERTQEDVADSGPDRARVPDRAERQERRAEREERRVERAERRAERSEAGGPDRPRRDGEDRTRPDRRFDGDGPRFARPDRNVERREGQVFPPSRERREDRRERIEDRREAREERRDDRRDARRERRDDWRVERRHSWDDRRGENGWPSWGRDAYRGGQVWSPGWRYDRRYDWNSHRRYNRGLYRLPRYYPPRGQGYQYRRFGLGVTLPRALIYESYWLDDPWTYRLPPAYGPYRWVRYYGDALLVDLRTGRVVDVVHDIFY